MPRVFIAIELPAAVLETLEIEIGRLKRADADVRWSTRAHLHVTLRFLGEVPDSSIAGVVHMIEEVCQDYSGLDIEARCVGSFPAGPRPKVVWAGIQGVTDWHHHVLRKLRGQLHERANGLGILTDREEFRPHVTLGRVKGPSGSSALAALISEEQDWQFGRFRVAELVLFRSQVSGEGSAYTPLRRVALGGPVRGFRRRAQR